MAPEKVFTGMMKILTFIGSIVGGFLAVSLAINTLVYAPLSQAIAQERQERESAIYKEAEERCASDNAKFEKLDKKLDIVVNQNLEISKLFYTYIKQTDINTKEIDKMRDKK